MHANCSPLSSSSPNAAVEGLHERVLLGAARLDEHAAGGAEATPVSVARATSARARCPSARTAARFRAWPRARRARATTRVDVDRLRAACITSASRVYSSMTLTSRIGRPSAGLVGLEVQRPDLIRHGGVDRRGRQGPSPTGRLRRRGTGHTQAFFAPHALHPLAIDFPALLAQVMVRAPVAPPRPLGGERAQRRA